MRVSFILWHLAVNYRRIISVVKLEPTTGHFLGAAVAVDQASLYLALGKANLCLPDRMAGKNGGPSSSSRPYVALGGGAAPLTIV